MRQPPPSQAARFSPLAPARFAVLVVAGLVCAGAGPGWAQGPDAPTSLWTADCHGDLCRMTIAIAHGESGPLRIAKLSVTVKQPSGIVSSAILSLPADADRDKPVAVGFADLVMDTRGQRQLKIAGGETQVLPIAHCTQAGCAVELVSAKPSLAQDIGRNLLKHETLLFYYFHDGERLQGSTSLDSFQDRYKQLPIAARSG